MSLNISGGLRCIRTGDAVFAALLIVFFFAGILKKYM